MDSWGDVGSDNSLALDSMGRPHISYREFNYLSWYNDDLKYAYWDGSTWQIQTVEWIGDVGHYTSLALDSSDETI